MLGSRQGIQRLWKDLTGSVSLKYPFFANPFSSATPNPAAATSTINPASSAAASSSNFSATSNINPGLNNATGSNFRFGNKNGNHETNSQYSKDAGGREEFTGFQSYKDVAFLCAALSCGTVFLNVVYKSLSQKMSAYFENKKSQISTKIHFNLLPTAFAAPALTLPSANIVYQFYQQSYQPIPALKTLPSSSLETSQKFDDSLDCVDLPEDQSLLQKLISKFTTALTNALIASTFSEPSGKQLPTIVASQREISSYFAKILSTYLESGLDKLQLETFLEETRLMTPLECLQYAMQGAEDTLSVPSYDLAMLDSFFEDEKFLAEWDRREKEFNEKVAGLVERHHSLTEELDQRVFAGFPMEKSSAFPMKFPSSSQASADRTTVNYHAALHSFLSTFSNTSDPRLQKILKKAISSLADWVDSTSGKIDPEEEEKIQDILWDGLAIVITQAVRSHDPQVSYDALNALATFSEAKDYGAQIVAKGGLELLRNVIIENFNHSPTATERFNLFCEVARILGNVALSEDNHVAVIGEGFLPVLRSWAFSSNLKLQTQAKRALANLASSKAKFQEHEEGGPRYHDGIFLLSSLETNKKADVDVVFIHGLLGGAFLTWRLQDDSETEPDNILEEESEESKNFSWPRHWLSEEIPTARILAVNYQTALSEWNSHPSRHAKSLKERSAEMLQMLADAQLGRDRPVVFVAHSMGGLLVKQMLLDAMKDEKYRHIASNFEGVVFYSTPHFGSLLAKSFEKLKTVLWLTIEVVELITGSQFLSSMNNEFAEHFGNTRTIINFGEMKETTMIRRLTSEKKDPKKTTNIQETQKKGEKKSTSEGLSTMIVAPESSYPGYGEFIKVVKDHVQVCKPASREDPIYTRAKQLVIMAQQNWANKLDSKQNH